MFIQVACPAEQAVRRIPRVRAIRSNTSRGSTDLAINFAWGTDMALALQPGGNTAQILRHVRRRAAAYRSRRPPDRTIPNRHDESHLVTGAAGSGCDASFIGVGLAARVLLVYLRDLRTTRIAIPVVPAVLAAAMRLLYVLDSRT
jgi:multidrug efflux pump subunit AcrB